MISSIIKGQILKDKMLYVVNQLLRSQGYASFKVRNDLQIGERRCPFLIKRDSTKKKFQNFLDKYPQFTDFCFALKTDTVKKRKNVLRQCIEKQRTTKKRKMSYKTVLCVTKGDIFQRAYLPASQKDSRKNTNKKTTDANSDNYSTTVFPQTRLRSLKF